MILQFSILVISFRLMPSCSQMIDKRMNSASVMLSDCAAVFAAAICSFFGSFHLLSEDRPC